MAEVVIYPLAQGQVLDGQYWAPMHYQRLLTSRWRYEAMKPENQAAGLFGFLLWMESLRQDPPGTLPVDEGELAMIAGFGADLAAWQRVRSFALHKWSVCQIEDEHGQIIGTRLFHPFVVEVAVDSIKRKAMGAAQRKSGHITLKKHRVRGKLKKLMRNGVEPPEAAVEAIAEWLVKDGLYVTDENVRIGWDNFIGRGAAAGKEL